VADDFRLVIEFEEEGQGLHFGRALGEREFEREVRDQLGDGVVVTRDGRQVFLYTATEKQAEAAEKVARSVLVEHNLRADVSPILRWDPDEDRWEDASGAPVRTGQTNQRSGVEAEDEDEEYAEWEVRVDLPSHGDAVEFAERLEAEGITPITRRWKYVLIGTASEEDAQALAERLRTEAPAGASVKAEPSATIAYELTSRNPFAMFGGFGPGP
jgi:hypothetical protein